MIITLTGNFIYSERLIVDDYGAFSGNIIILRKNTTNYHINWVSGPEHILRDEDVDYN